MIKLVAKPVVDKLEDDIMNKIHHLEEAPILHIVTVGEDNASKVYVGKKIKKAEELGIEAIHTTLPADIDQYDLNAELMHISDISSVSTNVNIGIILQLPLPAHLDGKAAMEYIAPEYDVDGFTRMSEFDPCTPLGIIELLKGHDIELEGKHVVIINRSDIVGKPLAKLMTDENATVTLCHSKTVNLEKHIQDADIVCFGIGIPKMFNSSHFREGQVIVDISMNRDENGKLCGDVDYDDVVNNLSDIAITPVPGSVGPMTVCMLMRNVLKL